VSLVVLATAGLIACPVATGDCVEKSFELWVFGEQELVEARGNRLTVLSFGEATHMGEVVLIHEITQFGDRVINLSTIIAANGDELYVLRETEWNPETGWFEGPYTVLGGTGRFEDATGSGHAVGGFGFVGVALSGTICY
jgi:hypothetical protein